MLYGNEKFKIVFEIALNVHKTKDLDVLLDRILSAARKFTNSDAGSIYVVEDGKLKFSHTQNDTLQKKLPTGKKLIYSTFSLPIDEKSIAGYVASKGELLNIPDVRSIPDCAPFRFQSKYDEISGYETRSMITLPLKRSGGDIIGVLQLINAMTPDKKITHFKKEDEPYIQFFADNAAMALERAILTRAIIMRMISMAELRDPKETTSHVNRVAGYAVEIYEHWANASGIEKEEIQKNMDLLRMAAMLHDVGKIAIPDAILKKPQRLNEEEYEIIKQHTLLGARLFSNTYSEIDEAAFAVALNHHEKWDGTGYPGHVDITSGKPLPGKELSRTRAIGKKGEEIHPFGRVVAIADVFDALSSRRCYKEAWDQERVLEIMRSESGKHFDPDMINSFFEVLDVINMISRRYPDDKV